MRLTAITAIGACAMLAACGKHDGKTVSMTNASIDEVAKSQAAQLQPGEWQMKIEQVSSETTGGSPGMPQMPKMPPVTNKVCLTAEQVGHPEKMFSGMTQMKQNCVYDSFKMADGKIDAKMHCALPGGMKVEGANSGTFSATAIASESHTTVTGLPGGMTTKSHIKMTGNRLGECQAGDLKAGSAG